MISFLFLFISQQLIRYSIRIKEYIMICIINIMLIKLNYYEMINVSQDIITIDVSIVIQIVSLQFWISNNFNDIRIPLFHRRINCLYFSIRLQLASKKCDIDLIYFDSSLGILTPVLTPVVNISRTTYGGITRIGRPFCLMTSYHHAKKEWF